jgi:ferredoxin
MAFKIKVDGEKCIGCGSCTIECPNFFKLEDGVSVPILNEVEELADCLMDVEGICPAAAIEIKKVE